MKVYVVNLARDVERMASVKRQLDALCVPFERVEAVDGSAMSADELRRAYSPFRWWCATGRRIRPGEVGCAASHYAIYAKADFPVCILEDDVSLAPEFPETLDEVSRFIDAKRPQVVLLSDLKGRARKEAGRDGITPSRGGTCTDGYVITPPACRVLLKANNPMETPCDHWGRWAKRGCIELYHAFPAVVAQRADVFGSSICHDAGIVRRSLPGKAMHAAARAAGLAIDALLWRCGQGRIASEVR